VTDHELTVDGVPVASYVVAPEMDIRLGPRPYLHPVRTLGGVTVTDAFPFDHPWHLGASLTVPYVNGFNLWGGRSCVPDEGYIWRDDHGRIVHEDWDPADVERLRWEDGAGRLLLRESRRITASPARLGWSLSFGYDLTAPPGADVVLGSPATSGYPGAGGYGGFFWRAGPGEARAFTAAGPDQVQGSAEPWVAMSVGGAYTLVFTGLRGDDRWFVRTTGYAGVCAALAYDKPLTVAAGSTLSREIHVLVADGELTESQIGDVSGGFNAGRPA
jgi:hypothetical protein